MKAPVVLISHSLKRARTVVLALGTLLAVFQILMILVARFIERSGSFDRLNTLIPPFVRELLGPSITGFMSFSGIVCLGYFHPIVMASLLALAISIATTLTTEIETGFIDLILSRPLPRHWIITRSILAGAICTALPLTMMLAATTIGLRFLAPPTAEWPSPRLLLSMVCNLGFLILCWNGVALLIASVSRRRGAAGWTAGLIALAAFLLDYVARAWPALQSISWLSPFHFYGPLDLLMGKSLKPGHLAALAAISIVSLALSYRFFSRRDIAH